MSRPCTALSVLASCLIVTAAGAAPVGLSDQGTWALAAPGVPAITGSLFLWHDKYQYETPKDVHREGDAIVGWLKGSTGGAKVSFRLTGRVDGDDLILTMTFRRPAGTNLNRGVLMLVQLPLEPLVQRVVRFSHSEPALVRAGFTGTGSSFAVNLDERRAFSLRLDRLVSFDRRGDSPKTVAVNVGLLPPDFPADQDVTVTATIGLTAAGEERLPWQHAMSQPLAIKGLKWAADRFATNDTATLDVDLAATYDNPFDPEQVALDAAITFPDGQVRTLPGYYHREYLADRSAGVEVLKASGAPGWRLRFTPTQAGRYTLKVTARDRTGRTVSADTSLTAEPSTQPGMLGISQHRTAFVRQPGGSVFLIGHNVPTYLAGRQGMAEAFDKMRAGGENYTRLWMYSAHLGLEWGQPFGTYRLAEAWRLDHAMKLARERGIEIMLCLDTHQDFIGARFEQNPYHVKQGGPIDTPMGFFSNEAAKRAYRNRLRYLVARWSHCTNLVAWEFANEIEGWKGFSENQELVAGWHSEMAQVIRGLDPYRHAISTSCWTSAGWPKLWNAPGLDFVQTHHYSNTRTNMAQRTVDITRQNRRDYPGRLLLFGEMGIHSHFAKGEGDDEDPQGVHLHEQNWAALMEGSASVPINWWHESYFEPHNLYGVFRGLARFTAQVDLDQPWQPTGDLKLAWVKAPEQPLRDDLEFAGSGDSWRKPAVAPRVVPRPDGQVTGREQLPALLQGKGHQDIRTTWTFELDLATAGQFIVHVGRASNSPRLLVSIDGQPVLDRPFPTGQGLGKESVYREQWKLWETIYDVDVAIPVPAGRHTLTLFNDGNDWLQITSIRLPQYLVWDRPWAVATGLSTGREAMCYVRNAKWWWLPVNQGATIPPVGATRLALPPLPAGRYSVERWDTVAGTVEQRTSLTLTGQGDQLDLPPFARDLALRIRPAGAAR